LLFGSSATCRIKHGQAENGHLQARPDDPRTTQRSLPVTVVDRLSWSSKTTVDAHLMLKQRLRMQ